MLNLANAVGYAYSLPTAVVVLGLLGLLSGSDKMNTSQFPKSIVDRCSCQKGNAPTRLSLTWS